MHLSKEEQVDKLREIHESYIELVRQIFEMTEQEIIDHETTVNGIRVAATTNLKLRLRGYRKLVLQQLENVKGELNVH